MIKLRNISFEDLSTVISNVTYSGYKVVVEHWGVDDFGDYTFCVSILTKEDDA